MQAGLSGSLKMCLKTLAGEDAMPSPRPLLGHEYVLAYLVSIREVSQAVCQGLGGLSSGKHTETLAGEDGLSGPVKEPKWS